MKFRSDPKQILCEAEIHDWSDEYIDGQHKDIMIMRECKICGTLQGRELFK